MVNNVRSKIDLLYNQTGKTNAAPRRGCKTEINQLPPDSRFRIESIASEKRISSLVVADLNGDGRPDLAYYGDPKELVVQYNLGSNNWSPPKRWPIDDGHWPPTRWPPAISTATAATDLVLLGENNIYFLAQNADHTLAEPRKNSLFRYGQGASRCWTSTGTGGEDLLLVNWDSPTRSASVCKTRMGNLGPEIYFSFPPIRAYLADDLAGDHKTEIVTIAQNSGRAAGFGV